MREFLHLFIQRFGDRILTLFGVQAIPLDKKGNNGKPQGSKNVLEGWS